MTITVAELQKGVMKYVEMATEEDVLVTQNGAVLATLTRPDPIIQRRLEALDHLTGIMAGTDLDMDDVREERLMRQ